MAVDKSERKYSKLTKVIAELRYERALNNAKELKILKLENQLLKLEQEVNRLQREIILQEVFG
ncbi:MAG: hypothetical protein IJ520_11300 [Synergistaceae bacterium]|nr:hypothetical protein [Synergistaceae bacterium]MBR1602537.1 hypothetical protein [Synergistaceae bacterium]